MVPAQVLPGGNLPANVAVRLTRVDGIRAELLLDAKKLVVLGQALGAARGTGLDLAGGEADGEVGDVGVPVSPER